MLGGGNTAMDCCRTVAPARRPRRQGRRALRLRRDEGLALGEGGRDARRRRDPQLSRAQGLHARARPPDRRDVRKGGRREGRSRPAHSRADRRARRPHRMRRRADRGRPGERLSLDRERRWARLRRRTACRRSIRSPSSRACPRSFSAATRLSGPKNIITAVAHGHEAAISIDAFCRGEDPRVRPPPMTNLVSQKMGIHEWSYDNAITLDRRFAVPPGRTRQSAEEHPHRSRARLHRRSRPSRRRAAASTATSQTVFSAPACIECDACVDICPIDCISFVPNAPEEELRGSLNAPALNLTQAIYVSEPVKTRARSWPRTRISACTAAFAPSAVRQGRGTCRSSPSKWRKRGTHANPSGKRLRHPFRQRQRLRLGERQSPVRALDPAHGRADRAAQHLSLEHPGPADLVRGSGQRTGSPRRARRRRHAGRDEPADLRPGRRRDRAGRLSLLRFDAAHAAFGAARRHRDVSACR